MWRKRVRDLTRVLAREDVAILESSDLDDVVDAEIGLEDGLSLQVTILGEVGINRWDEEDQSMTLVDYYGNQVPAREIVAHVKDLLVTS
jgi:hypothetical protein